MKIKDFFNSETMSSPSQLTTMQSSQKFDQAVQKRKIAQPPPAANDTMMTINLHIEKPDIILLEDMDDINSNCIVLNVSLRY